MTVLIALAAGFIVGFVLRHRSEAKALFTHLSDWSIYILLFFMGISVGTNEDIISNIGTIGLQVVIITAGALAGSIGLSYFVYRIFFRSGDER